MSVNLMDMVKNVLDGPLVGQLSGMLGEGEEATRNAINVGVPAILGGLLKRSSDASGAEQIFGELTNVDGGMLDNLGGILGGDTSKLEASGSGYIESLFGPGLKSIVAWISKTAGIRDASAQKLLALLAPIVMGVLGKQKQEQGLDAKGLSQFLAAQRDVVASELPSELTGAISLSQSASASIQRDAIPEKHPDLDESGGGIMRFIFPAVLIAAIAFFLTKSFDGASTGGNEVDDGLNVPEIEIPEVEIPDVEIPDETGTPDDSATDDGESTTPE